MSRKTRLGYPGTLINCGKSMVSVGKSSTNSGLSTSMLIYQKVVYNKIQIIGREKKTEAVWAHTDWIKNDKD